jgi:hypothetical protein
MNKKLDNQKKINQNDFVQVPYSHVYTGWPFYLTMNNNELPRYVGIPYKDINPNDLVYTLARYTTDYNPPNLKN